MPPVNDFLPFCPTDTGTNLLTQSEYAADPQQLIGNQPGIARSKLVNKAVRQATYIASCFAQYLANVTGNNVLDNATPSQVITTLGLALNKPPTVAASAKNAASATAGNPIIWSTVGFDTASAYNPANGQFTAPGTGFFLICTGFSTADASTSYSPFINGVVSSAVRNFGATQAGGQGGGSAVISLSFNDILTIRPFNGNVGADPNGFLNIVQLH